jgi:DNA-binding CsgD family transcriptional regulator
MSNDRLARLTEAQREVLRLWHVRKSAKQIGRELGITHWAVNERLRSARRALGVGSSGEAAAMLASWEEGEAYKRVVCDPPAVAPAAEQAMFSAPGNEPERPFEVREERVPFQATRLASTLRLPLPRFRGERNDLSIRTRLLWIGLITVGVAITVAALALLATGVVNMIVEIRDELG